MATRYSKLILNRTKAADGTVTEHWQIDTPDDVRLYQQMMELSASQPSAERVDSEGAAHARGPSGHQACRGDHHPGQGPRRLAGQHQPGCLPKTYTIKKTAIEALVSFLGDKAKLHTVTRSDLARWYQHMRTARPPPP
jgi:hypothetical protein